MNHQEIVDRVTELDRVAEKARQTKLDSQAPVRAELQGQCEQLGHVFVPSTKMVGDGRICAACRLQEQGSTSVEQTMAAIKSLGEAR